MLNPNKENYFTDKDWVRSIFMINQEELDGAPMGMRTWSTADTKFQDTALGGSLVINPLPQPSVFTDPISSTHAFKVFNGAEEGLSPYYSEAFDDNYRVVTFRLGTLAFTSLSGFLLNMYSPGAASMINKGLISRVIFWIGRVIGTGISLITWPLQVMGFVAKGINYMMRKPTSRYAYLKPNMPLYWSSVQVIVNHFLTDLGLVYRGAPKFSDGSTIEDLETDAAQVEAMRNFWPNIYGSNGYANDFMMNFGNDGAAQIDVFVVANRAQRMAHRRFEMLEEANTYASNKIDIMAMMKKLYRERGGRRSQTIAEYFQNWVDTAGSLYDLDRVMANTGGTPSKDPGVDGDSPRPDNLDKDGLNEFFKSELRDGGAYISFRVDDTGAVSETFTNSYKQSQLAEKINGISASMRETTHDFAGGNIGDGAIANTLETMVSGIKTLATGVISGIGLEGLLIAGGGGTVSMPKYWESSEAQLPKAQYSFTLKARYANRRAAFQDIYFPLACILATALPVSVGKHSHSNPFYFEFYDKGRMQSRLAAIDSLTISRGDGTMGFTPDGHLMSVNVSFSIVPMEETIAMPITEGYSMFDTFTALVGGGVIGGAAGSVAGPAGTAGGSIGGATAGAITTAIGNLVKGIFDDDTPWMDYMATLAGLGVNEQHYLMAKLKRRLATNRLNLASTYSSARAAAFAADSPFGAIFSTLAIGTEYQQAFFFDERSER